MKLHHRNPPSESCQGLEGAIRQPCKADGVTASTPHTSTQIYLTQIILRVHTE